MWLIIWRYKIKPTSRQKFYEYYNENGHWVWLFRKHPGYIITKLYQDQHDSCIFLTFDYWRSLKDFELFKQDYAIEYQKIDDDSNSLTETEQLVIAAEVNLL